MAELCFNTFNVSAYLLEDEQLELQVAAASAAGFPWFGPDVHSIRRWLAGGRTLAELRDLVEAAGMQVWELSNMPLGEPELSRTEAREIAGFAAGLGARWVLTNVRLPITAGLLATFDEQCTILADVGHGARPAIEFLPWSPACSAASTMPLLDHVGTDRARILYDVWHQLRGPDTLAGLEAVAPDSIAYVQFSDALPVSTDDLMGETLQHRTFPGEGELALDDFCAILRRKGFDGVVSVEILSDTWRTGDQFEFARRAFHSTRRYWP